MEFKPGSIVRIPKWYAAKWEIISYGAVDNLYLVKAFNTPIEHLRGRSWLVNGNEIEKLDILEYFRQKKLGV